MDKLMMNSQLRQILRQQMPMDQLQLPLIRKQRARAAERLLERYVGVGFHPSGRIPCLWLHDRNDLDLPMGRMVMTTRWMRARSPRRATVRNEAHRTRMQLRMQRNPTPMTTKRLRRPRRTRTRERSKNTPRKAHRQRRRSEDASTSRNTARLQRTTRRTEEEAARPWLCCLFLRAHNT